jgi:DNA-binding XRE family transcriptional regulator
MRQVNFRQVIEEILATYEINETELGRRVGITQQSINKLRRGVHIEPSYAVGAKLVAMHDARPLMKGGARK